MISYGRPHFLLIRLDFEKDKKTGSQHRSKAYLDTLGQSPQLCYR